LKFLAGKGLVNRFGFLLLAGKELRVEVEVKELSPPRNAGRPV
jgi:hypothetical protein